MLTKARLKGSWPDPQNHCVCIFATFPSSRGHLFGCLLISRLTASKMMVVLQESHDTNILKKMQNLAIIIFVHMRQEVWALYLFLWSNTAFEIKCKFIMPMIEDSRSNFLACWRVCYILQMTLQLILEMINNYWSWEIVVLAVRFYFMYYNY